MGTERKLSKMLFSINYAGQRERELNALIEPPRPLLIWFVNSFSEDQTAALFAIFNLYLQHLLLSSLGRLRWL
jgi:hypothetical protein